MLNVPNSRPPFFRFKIFFVLKYESKDKVQDYGGAKRKEREINKIETNRGGFNAHFFT